jgi:hypothetical protein
MRLSATPVQQDPEETGGQSSQRLWLFIQSMIGQETLVMSSEEDEALSLTNNNSLEWYNRTLKKLVGSHPNVSGSSSSH